MNGIQYCLVAQGKQKEATEETDNYVKANPTSGIGEDLLLKHGDLLYAQKDFSGAEREYRRFVQQYPKSKNLATAYYWTAKSLQAQDKLDDAVATYETAVSTTNSNSKITALSLYELSVLYSSLKKYDKAFAALSRIEKEYKDSDIAPDASYAKGVLFLENENFTEAKNQFDALIAQFPSSEAADKGRIGLVRVHIAEKAYISAQRMAQSIATARVDEVGAEAQYLAGVAYADAKDWSSAVTAFLRVKYVFPAYEQWLAKAYLGLGSAYEATKDIRLAKDAYQSVIRFKRETETVGEAEKRLKELEKL
jgi:TolA-binding protein